MRIDVYTVEPAHVAARRLECEDDSHLHDERPRANHLPHPRAARQRVLGKPRQLRGEAPMVRALAVRSRAQARGLRAAGCAPATPALSTSLWHGDTPRPMRPPART